MYTLALISLSVRQTVIASGDMASDRWVLQPSTWCGKLQVTDHCSMSAHKLTLEFYCGCGCLHHN